MARVGTQRHRKKNHPDVLYLRQQECKGPWLFFEAKGVSASKNSVGNTALKMWLLCLPPALTLVGIVLFRHSVPYS